MAENGLSVYQQTKLIPDAVILYIEKQVFHGWEDVKITKELNSAASDFTLKLTDRWAQNQESWKIAPGNKVHLHAGKYSALTGYIDSVQGSISSNERSISVSGRSKTCDIVDCSVLEPNQYDGLTFDKIAKQVCAPFGISVTMNSDPGAAFERITLQQGEAAFALLDRLARQRKLIMRPGAEGDLVFEKAGARNSKTELKLGQNILSGNINQDNSNRFSKYIIKGQGTGALGEALQVTEPSSESIDGGINRYRPMLMLAESSVDESASENRAQYERELRAAKALTVEVQVRGWFQAPGSLWELNELVFVDIGALGIRRKMLISKVEFNKNGSGTTTNLSLIRKDAYDFGTNKEKPAEDNLGWTKALDK